MSLTCKAPQLRFKEFSGEWEEKKLGDILSFKNGINATKEQYGKGYKFINVLDIINNATIKYENIIGLVDVSKEIFEKNEVVYGNILFQRSSETRIDAGQSNVYLDKKNSATFGGFVIRGQQKIDYNPEFINYMFKTQFARKEISQKSNGSTHFNVGQETLSKVLIVFPSKPEQEKIASFLSAMDGKIEKLTCKAKLLEEYKKGVMQKIFSQTLRFKEDNGSEYPEWVEKKLEEVSHKYYQGINTAADNVNYYKSGYPILQAKHITDEFIDFFDVKYLNEDDYNSYKDKYRPVKDDILISNIGTLGKVVLVENEVDFLVAWNIFKISLNLELINSKFILYLLRKISSDGYFERMKSGNATKFVNKTDMINIRLHLPSLKEQTKIANFLSSIDEKLYHVSKQLEETKAFKKALLQQMFV